MKGVVTICKIGGPMGRAPIEMWMSSSEVGIRMPLDDFLRALASEVGSPALLMTSKALEKKLMEAADTIVAAMKKETARLV
jgi:tRNA A37 threonylcarbamoyladenosine synthetase subunit TsaC/SUA5/YrdC